MASANFIGTVSEFDPSKEQWTNYQKRLEIWMKANKCSEEDKVTIFLALIGAEAFEAVSNYVSPDEPTDKTYAQLTEILQKHYQPTHSEISMRLQFRNRKQQPNESISEYILELKKLSKRCGYGAELDTNLRDTFVGGLRSDKLQANLLLKGNDLTWKTACQRAQDWEMSQTDSKHLQGETTQTGLNKIFLEKHSKKPQREAPKCYRCLGSHDPRSCPYIKYQCRGCSKIGHLQRACDSSRSKGKKNQQGKFQGYGKGCDRGRGTNKNKPGGTHMVDIDESKNYSDYVETVKVGSLYATNDNQNDPENVCKVDVHEVAELKAELKVAGKQINFVVDTAASVTVISETQYQKTLAHVALNNTDAKLKSYCNSSIPVVGCAEVEVEYEGSKHKLPLVIVGGSNVALLGRNWLKFIKLNWKEMFQVSMVKPKAKEILDKHKNVFKPAGPEDRIRGHKANINIQPDSQPKFFKARPVPYVQLETVEKELNRLETAGVIKHVTNSDWATPLVIVPKADSSVRLCGDYRVTVNNVIESDTYPLPTTEDLFATLAGGKIFSKIDLSSAYLQLELSEASKKLLTVNTHKGLYQYERLPFGVSVAPSQFQCVMDKVLSGMKGVVCFLDDILISSKDEAEHLRILDDVLTRLDNHGIKANRSKCYFMVSSVTYLGHKIDAEGIHPTQDKVEAILNAKTPENVSELRTFIGIVTYYCKFIPNMSTRFAPLYKLLRDDAEWSWTTECEQAVNDIKNMLTSDQILVHYDPKKPIILACDASPFGVGAVLSHIVDEVERPVAYASRTLTSAEKNYSQVEREALAIVFGVTKFNKYLYGRKFTLLTDHEALTVIFGPKKGIPSLAAARLQRWALILMAHQYDIKYRKSADHANADVLSRFPVEDEQNLATELPINYFSYTDDLPVSAQEISAETHKDPVLGKVLNYTMNGWPKHNSDENLKDYFSRRRELTVDQGCILWGLRVVIPPRYRERLVKELHQEHTGIVRMKSVARSYFWYPKLDADIEQIASDCDVCASMKNSAPQAPFMPWSRTEKPWQRVHIDFCELSGKHFLIMVDAYSKWICVEPMNTTTSTKTINVLRSWFAIYGLPVELVSDNGPQLCSAEFELFLSKNGIKHILVPPYHPQSNGAAERSVQIVKGSLKKYLVSDQFGMDVKVPLQHRLDNFLFSYRITPQTTTSCSPYELLFRHAPRTRFTLLKPDVNSKVSKQQDRQCVNHDTKGTRLREFSRGDKVMVKNFRGGKLKHLAGVIVERKGPLTYIVRIGTSTRYCHIDHLSRAGNVSTTPEQDETQTTEQENKLLLPTPVTVNPTLAMPEAEENGGTITTKPVQSIPSEEQTTDPETKPVIEQSELTSHASPARRRYPMRIRRPPNRLINEQ